MNILWNQGILRNAEDEGGGGAGFEGEGALDAAPAPVDRTAALEARLEKMAKSLDGFMSSTQQREADTQASQFEARIRGAEAKAKADVDKAESALAEAYDEGEGMVIAKAQRVLSEATAEAKRIQVMAGEARAKLKAGERREGGTRAGGRDDLDTSNLENWKTKHASWYGVDKDMTKAAHEVDAQIRAAGVLESGSTEYFNAVDRQMRQKFPDRFNGSAPTAGGGGGGAAPSGGQSRIPASVAEGYRRMGIDVNDPAVAKRMVANREHAVRKGWLSETPATGRILTR